MFQIMKTRAIQYPWGKTKSFYWSSKAECVNKLFRIKNNCLLKKEKSVVCLQYEKKQETRVKGAFVVLSHWLNTADHFLSATFTSFPKLLLHQTKEPSDGETHEHLHNNHTCLLQCLMCDKYELCYIFPLWIKKYGTFSFISISFSLGEPWSVRASVKVCVIFGSKPKCWAQQSGEHTHTHIHRQTHIKAMFFAG